MTDDLWDRYRAATKDLDRNVFWQPRRNPQQVLRALADAAEELDLGWDQYAARGAVARLEEELTELFGTGGAAWFPSGTMAQQAALRVWCDRAGTRRVALPDIAHPLVHENDGPRLLHGFEVVHLTTGRRTPTVADVEAIPGRLAAVLAELPLRDAGCALPSWEELTSFSEAVRARGSAVHFDGARLWESQPFWDKPFPEIATLADSVYVSFYKGLGGLAGAALVGPVDFLDEVRVWRQRMGGTLFRSTPEVLAALVGLRDRLPRMADHLAWARALAVELEQVGLTPNPSPPHTPTFEVFGPGDADAVNERLLAFIEREQLEVCGPWHPSDEPGRVRTELMCSDSVHAFDPAEVARWLGEIVVG